MIYVAFPEGKVKPEMRSEAIKRLQLCSAQTKSAVKLMLKELSNTKKNS